MTNLSFDKFKKKALSLKLFSILNYKHCIGAVFIDYFNKKKEKTNPFHFHNTHNLFNDYKMFEINVD